MTVTINQVLQQGIQRLTNHGKSDAALDARLLLSHTLNYDRVALLIHGSDIIEQKEYQTFFDYIEQRAKGIPLQHIIGEQEFMGLTFKVNNNTLIPRRETEELVELALSYLSDSNKQLVMDMGTGSGCIPIALSYFKDNIACIGVDYSKLALDMAKLNSEANSVDEKITWILSDIFKEVPNNLFNNVDMIISNPPYIKSDEIEDLMTEVKDYEPRMALDGGKDGLDFYRTISIEGKKYLKQGGYILFEIGHDQREAVMHILIESGYMEIGYKKDLSGIDRIVYAQK